MAQHRIPEYPCRGRHLKKGSDVSNEAAIERLGRLPTATVSDALDAFGLPGSLLGIGRTTGQAITGRAFTVRYEPVDDEGGTVGDFLDEVAPGNVIIIDNAGRPDCTVWGGIMSRVAAARGIAGTVISGVCRDVATSEEVGYALWSAGRFMRTGKDRVRCTGVQVPIVIDDVKVIPGDFIHADADGVVAVPAGHIDAVLDLAERIDDLEDQIVNLATSGSTLTEARRQLGYHTLQSRNA
jgi:regulator of RNase E activity RraA